MNTIFLLAALFMGVFVLNQRRNYASYPPASYSVDAFIEPIECIDDGFDLPSYLDSSRVSSTRIWYENMPIIGIKGHEFISIGKGWGESCLLSPEAAGCRPFRNVIRKFQELETCVQGIKADGKWMQGQSATMTFERFQYSDASRIVTRLVMLATKLGDDPDGWDKAVAAMTTDGKGQKVIKNCLNSISRNELKCYPVLMGAPGFTGVSLFEHSKHGHPTRRISKTCKIPPICSRLAVQRLYQFQTMRFQPNLIVGGADVLIQLARKKTWVDLPDTTIRNQGCELKNQYKKNGIVCWYFAKCAQFMMEQICQEHEQCCPTPDIHEACKQE